jgi:hypothetical protein
LKLSRIKSKRWFLFRNIKKHVKVIEEFKEMYDKDDVTGYVFDESIKNNYLKIISNIFYLNIRKAQKKFKDEYIDKSSEFRSIPQNELSKKFNDLYKHFLKQTRSEVIEFFNLKQTEQLSLKILLRIYPYFFSPYSPFRKEYDQMNKLVNQLIAKIANDETGRHYIDELYYDHHEDAILTPRNVNLKFIFRKSLTLLISSSQRKTLRLKS